MIILRTSTDQPDSESLGAANRNATSGTVNPNQAPFP